jgi:hypothetical protein
MEYKMPQQLEIMTRSDYSVSASALKEIPDPEDREQIAALAYEFWQGRGCLDGTPDEDWFRAEREIAKLKRLAEKEGESLRFVERSTTYAEEVDAPALRFPVRSEILQTSRGRTAKTA